MHRRAAARRPQEWLVPRRPVLDPGPSNLTEVYWIQALVAEALGSTGAWKVGARSPEGESRYAPIASAGIHSSPAWLPGAERRLRGIEAGEDVMLAGPIGTGKTHIAIALGVQTARRRYRVVFVCAADLVRELIEARDEGELLARYRRVHLLIYPSARSRIMGVAERARPRRVPHHEADRSVPDGVNRALSSYPGAALIGMLTLALVLGVREAGWMEGLELSAYDWYVRTHQLRAESPSVALVLVTDDDIAALGNEWPLTDATLARVLGELLAREPSAVGLDIIRDTPIPPGEDALRELLSGDPRVIAAMTFGDANDPGIPAPAPLRGTDREGFIDVVLDRDGVVRRGLLFLDDGRAVSFAFALRLALVYLAERGVAPEPDPANPSHIRLGRASFRPLDSEDGGYVGADTRGYQFLIDYRERASAYATYTLSEFIEGRGNIEDMRGKVVIVGVSAASVKDHFLSPLGRVARDEVLMPGVELHGRMVSQILRWALDDPRPLRTLGAIGEALWIALWCALGLTVGYRGRAWSPTVASGLACIVVLVVLGWVLFGLGWWIPVVPCAAAWLLAAGLVAFQVTAAERRERGTLMRLFARHVSPELAELIWAERDRLLDGVEPRAQRLTATVLFSDIQGFTSVAEGLEPDRLMQWLNEYMEAMAPHVTRHGGVVLRFFGDAILAAFGVPIRRASEEEIANDARNAVECAIAMSEALVELNAQWDRRGLPVVATRIGLYTGEMVAGSLGSADRLEYTVQGDAVNTAQRLESLDKEAFAPHLPDRPCRILAGEPTVELVAGHVLVEPLGVVQVRGKARPMGVFRILGRTGPGA